MRTARLGNQGRLNGIAPGKGIIPGKRAVRLILSAMGLGLIASAALPNRAHANGVPRDGLVFYMAFEERQGTALFDSAAEMATGTLEGSAILAPQGKHGGCYLSTGAKGATARIPNRPDLNPTSAITIAAWAYAETWTGANRRILQKSVSPQDLDNQYRMMFEAGALGFQLYPVGRINIPPPSLKTWHHLAGTYDGKRMRLYVDGVEQGSLACAGAIAVQDQDLFIGSKIGHDNFDGRLDDVVIYNRALSAGEIAMLAEAAGTGLAFDRAVSPARDRRAAISFSGDFLSRSLRPDGRSTPLPPLCLRRPER